RRLGGNESPPFDQVAEFIRDVFANTRAKKIYETIIFSTLGTDFENYRGVGVSLPAYLEKQGGLFQQMMMFSQNFNPGVDFLVAGVDDSGAHLSHVANPGTVSQLQKLGHAAIGSGGIHAMTRLSLAGQSRGRGLLDTLVDVFGAK